jgi:hypothetical protein
MAVERDVAPLVISCPTTGRDVSTGLAINRADFEILSPHIGGRASCHHCDADHFWTKKDAWITEVDALVAQRSGGYEHPPVGSADRDPVVKPPLPSNSSGS